MTYSEFRNRFTSVEAFELAYGRLSMEEARALIDAEKCAPFIKACMITKWGQARREVLLANIKVAKCSDGALHVVFYEGGSEPGGNNFVYRCALDLNSTNAFLQMIPHRWDDEKTDIEEWLIENLYGSGSGGELKETWSLLGLHGYAVWEDRPEGIYREEEF